MSRIFPRLPILRGFTRLGFPTRPLIPLAQSVHGGLRLAHRSLFPSSLRRQLSTQPSRQSSNSPPPSPTQSDSQSSSGGSQLPENASLTERLKFLIKKYGWYALGMYFFFSTLDFSLTFAAINFLGAEYVEALVKSIKAYLPAIFPAHDETADAAAGAAVAKTGYDNFWAMLALSYGIHKTLLLPFRVGLTAAFTPRFVGWLAKRGWIGRDGAKRAATEMRDRMRRSSRDRD